MEYYFTITIQIKGPLLWSNCPPLHLDRLKKNHINFIIRTNKNHVFFISKQKKKNHNYNKNYDYNKKKVYAAHKLTCTFKGEKTHSTWRSWKRTWTRRQANRGTK